ncbi:LytR/AlgR family response regulator transcription factor [Paludibaculum fermentans]|uniref:Response regulator transcription factor n=1 Tax=Paludibaculum fermentans TaxID=1473598 RepID=A0A7S7NVT8_PALFE|nr:LytTR family DNA-binding domain-containing protein [Paludibaculum fermentans]QOY90119.1 response regulator transcription factor [Paludibaculum fermentans]
MPFTALLVDDEPLAREGLRMLLAEDPEISEVLEAKNGREAVEIIRRAKPDLVFLDVQMPEVDGFGVIHEIGVESMPAVVFVTAHDVYAIQAFDINAVDYLLKPVTRERFVKSLARAKEHLRARPAGEASRQILSLLETIAAPTRTVKRLAVRTAGKTVFVEVEDIDWFEAAENYVQLHAGRAEHLLHVTMNTLEKSLDPELFLRIHRSIIVNVRRIKELQPVTHGEYVITLSNGVRLQSGRMYTERVKTLAANPF